MDSKLAMKIYNVMCETEGLEKDLTVGKGQNEYKAVGEKTVLNMIKPLFKKHKLIMIPKDGEISEDVFSYVDGYGKNKLRAITQLKVYFTLIDAETGESVDVIGFGNGADSQDKGSGKAFTYALKTALNKTFMMFSGEDTDNQHSDDINDDRKVTTKELLDIIEEKGQTTDAVIKLYKKETGKTVDEIKYISADKKIEYYDRIKASGDKS